jgi:predicted ribosome quality control (RQC) complex YloA/Tae2 family protein
VHNNYYFLVQLSAQLKVKLEGFTLVSCFSQSKDELMMEFHNRSQSFFIKASLQAQFCCLSFPTTFNRARKNTVDLFNEVLMKQVLDVKSFENERSFSIQLQDSYSLVFKMHGNRSNIVLFNYDHAIQLFRNHLTSDMDIKLSTLHRTIDWSKETFKLHIGNLPLLYFTFGKWCWNWLGQRKIEKTDTGALWNEIQDLKLRLEKPVFYLAHYHEEVILTLLPIGEIIQKFNDPMEAINAFFHTYAVAQTLHSEKSLLRKKLTEQIKSGRIYIQKNKIKLDELRNDHHYQQWGDLVMAHMHEMKTGMERIQLSNFYDQSIVEIKLKKELSPQKNAALFYRKAKNKQIEIDKLIDAIEHKEQEIISYETTLQFLEAAEDIKSLRKNIPTQITGSKSPQKSLPYHEFEFQGFKIWVGKNAERNDQLTFKHSFKEDLWLHARDVAGSHVLIKHQSGKSFPRNVIERAAQLAAYNSKRKTETLCPVAYTPRKYVRKRKGYPAGAVIVEREEVIMVEPKL